MMFILQWSTDHPQSRGHLCLGFSSIRTGLLKSIFPTQPLSATLKHRANPLGVRFTFRIIVKTTSNALSN